MPFETIRPIADAVLYEGCMLYPYRRSALKNQRLGWVFGALLPEPFATRNPNESASFQAQLLAVAPDSAELTVEARFLQLEAQSAGKEPRTPYHARSLTFRTTLATLLEGGYTAQQSFQAARELDVHVRLAAERCADGSVRVCVNVENCTRFPDSALDDRDVALEYALLAANAIAGISPGGFVSLLDPPDALRGLAAACRQSGIYPVLAGAPGEHAAVLLSPIILQDYPQIAPESNCNFFDGTEVDEMLTLRMLSLSEAERREILGSTDLGSELLRRTEALSSSEVLNLHGARRLPEDSRIDSLKKDSFGEKVRSVTVSGVKLSKGSRVRLRPRRQADVFDTVLEGKTATIEAVETTMEGELFVAVLLDEDPGRDLGELRLIAHRFFFRPDEVEPICEQPAAAREELQ